MQRRLLFMFILAGFALVLMPSANLSAQDSGTTDDGSAAVDSTDDGSGSGDGAGSGGNSGAGSGTDSDAGTGDTGSSGDTGDTGESDDDDGAAGGATLKIVPPKTRVLVGKTRQFRTAGPSRDAAWLLADASAEGIADIDADGLLTAAEGGWVIVGLEDPQTLEVLGTTDTVWIMGGPTKVGKKGGRVFAASDTFVTVDFPPNASERAMIAHIEKRGLNELPEQAQGRGTAVAVFEFNVTDAETGDDVGGAGFDEDVSLTLHYSDDMVPEGVSEEELAAATFDENNEVWEAMPDEVVVDVDTDANTITVSIGHASFWGVFDGNTIAQPQTAVDEVSWGVLKRANAR